MAGLRHTVSGAFLCLLTCSVLTLPACSGDGGGSADDVDGGASSGGANDGTSSSDGDGDSQGSGSSTGGSNDGGATGGKADAGVVDLTKCGNNAADPAEECDDGNRTAGDGCDSGCKKEEGFTCTSPGAACEECGNKIVESTEACDDGNRSAGDGCSISCQLEAGGWVCPVAGEPCEQCGDGVVAAQELCDDGNGMAGDGCAADCRSVEANYSCPIAGGLCELCGNGSVAGSEVCDDGNTTTEGGCTFNCKAEEAGWVCPKTGGACTQCGDKIVNGALEQCDDGNIDESDGCTSKCQREAGSTCLLVGQLCFVCGNGFIEPLSRDDKGTVSTADDSYVLEECDDGNQSNGDGCDAGCQQDDAYDCPVPGFGCNLCGDGLVTGLEKCDDGKQCTNGSTCDAAADCAGIGDGTCVARANDGCAADCSAIQPFYHCDVPGEPCARCGDGKLNFGEQCDDGVDTTFNQPVGGDGCSRTCQVESGWFCGTKIDLSFDGCSLCGNGLRERSEVCDDDNTTAGDGCSADCSAVATGYNCFFPGFPCAPCGNGVIEPGEQCDEGAGNDSAGCDARCQVVAPWVCIEQGKPCELCGDGTLGANYESCEDGNIANDDGCSSTCEVEPGYDCESGDCLAVACGDGFRAGTEECDDGNQLSGDGCSIACDTERGFVCAGATCRSTVCGDTVIEGEEQCDDGNALTPGCDAECQLEPGYKCPDAGRACSQTVCGDGFVEGTEACDDGSAATPGCAADCTLEPGYACSALASVCNNVGTANDGAACASELGCPVGDCSPRGGACRTTVCEDGIVEGSEECDDGGVAGVCRGGSEDGLNCGLDADCAGGGICVDGCTDDCTLSPFYNCDGSPSECSPILEFVAIRRFNISNVSPDGLVYDPFRRAFAGHKQQSSQKAIELCLDGTIIDPGDTSAGALGTIYRADGSVEPVAAGYLEAPRPVTSGTLLEAAYDAFTGHFLFLTKQGTTVTLTDVPLCTLSAGCTGRFYRDAAHPTESLANFQVSLTGADGAQGLTVGEDGDLYVTDDVADSVVVFPRRRSGTSIVVPSCATASETNCTTFASAPDANRDFSTPTGDVLDAIFTVPGEEMVALFNQYAGALPYTGTDMLDNSTYTSSEYFSFYQPLLGTNPPLYGRSALPGLLFDLGTVGRSYQKYAQSAETAPDGGAFIICPQNPSEDCQLFARVCDSDADCAEVAPGTRCNLAAAVPYCSSPGDARDDRLTVDAGVQDTRVDVLANDSRSESACISPIKKVVAVTGASGTVGKVCVGGASVGAACSVNSNCGSGGVCTATIPTTITTVRGGTVVISNNGDNVTYDAPSNAQLCGFIDNFTYTADLGGGVIDTANVRVVVACDCGDNIKQGNEQCDLGSQNGPYPKRCSLSCALNIVCGDRFIDPGEECDDGAVVSGDGCSARCTLESICGDGIDEGVEACDDGNTVSGDTCNANCTLPRCGDGNTDVQKAEQCDDGPNNGAAPAGCSALCTVNSVCGNNVVEGSEQCDKGTQNGTSASDCSIACKVLGDCGNGTIEGSEECDPLAPASQCGGNACLDRCICTNYCGDARVGGLEECDDGNAALNDGCTPACKSEICGDAVKQTNEQCDDGDTDPTDGCTNDCRVVVICGDGTKNALEECDDGNNLSGDKCSSACKDETVVCGDGRAQFPETCDDGGTVPNDGCGSTCRLESGSCGNNTVDSAEQCDDGNRVAGDDCSPDCRFEGCGDAVTAPGEYCDDGNRTSGDGCGPTCQLEIL